MSNVLSLPLLGGPSSAPAVPDGVIPLTDGKTCGTGCGGGGTPRKATPSTPKQRELSSFNDRRLDLNAIPSRGTPVTHIDMDLTVECNLRCVYCFKEKWTEHMADDVAFDTIVWLIHASGPIKDIGIAFMGGEPLLRFKLIKRLVPFAMRRAAQHGKNLGISMTTNGTLVTDEVTTFWKKWNLGFHTSIDGPPEIQDKNRPTTGGKGSSRLVEVSSRRILDSHPNTCARCTVTSETAHSLVASYEYFRGLGYTDIAFVPGGMPYWDAATVEIYREQYRRVAEMAMDDMRAGVPIRLKGVDDYAESVGREGRNPHSCGAGRGMVLVDIYGDLWPCHRWNKQSEDEWKIGSIYGGFREEARSQLDVPSFVDLLQQPCHVCEARLTCSGGCPAENLEDTGTVYKRHPNACELTRVWARTGRYVHDTMMAERNAAYSAAYLEGREYDTAPH